eukprot:UN02542
MSKLFKKLWNKVWHGKDEDLEEIQSILQQGITLEELNHDTNYFWGPRTILNAALIRPHSPAILNCLFNHGVKIDSFVSGTVKGKTYDHPMQLVLAQTDSDGYD